MLDSMLVLDMYKQVLSGFIRFYLFTSTSTEKNIEIGNLHGWP